MGEPATTIVFESPAAERRLARARSWLAARGRSERVLIVGSPDATAQASRLVARALGASFGWERSTLGRVAGALAGPALAARDLTPAGTLPLEALCARMVHALGPAALGRFEPIAALPGLPRALMRTLDELRLAGLGARSFPDPDLARLLAAYERELAESRLADRALVLTLAIDAARERAGPGSLVGAPLLALDPLLANARERDFFAVLVERASVALVTLPEGDEATRAHLVASLPSARMDRDGDLALPASALHRLQAELFAKSARPIGPAGDARDVEILSAPGESRECVEIARRIRREADAGARFDRIAVLLRSPLQYRAHLEEAFRRAGIPAYFARGTVRPDPTGRAFLALLGCAVEGLSARRFAEYLSLGEVTDATAAGAPPTAVAPSDRWVPPDVELIPEALERAADAIEPPPEPATSGTVPAPRRWERLLVEGAVIGGLARWRTRLGGLRAKFAQERAGLSDADDPVALRLERDMKDLDALAAFALPLLEDLAALPRSATWGEWLTALAALATRSLRAPDRVLAILSELEPMASVGPVEIGEVRLVLDRRLTDLIVLPGARRAGRVYVASVAESRGLDFDVVFVPGLAEKIFPQKVTEDPILPDRARLGVGAPLPTNESRTADERTALRLAVGAARRKIVFSYPRLDVEQSRPRTPSFYGLEILRAAEGKLPGFDELARRAEVVGAARLGWPAPARAADSIDEAEHDLALLESIFKQPESATVGTARYLLSVNAHLARALRFRARRWIRKWTPADGLVEPDAEARAALALHSFSARSYSPTALQNYAACPYRFLLQAVHRLAPREEPSPIEELDPLQRGSLIHDVLFAFYGELRAEGLLPVTAAGANDARARLERAIDRVARRYKDELAPAIDRVWDDGIAAITADLRELLRRAIAGDSWVPAYFELSFGPLPGRSERDPRSVDDPVELSIGMKLRGSIDLVERNARGALRATDYKTGKARAKDGLVIGGGQTLQPVLYALALEGLFPVEPVDAGRLYFCTSTGDFSEVTVALDAGAREAAKAVVDTIGRALDDAFLPAAPAKGACTYCDYLRVCGPYEELRTTKVKSKERLEPLAQLRRRP